MKTTTDPATWREAARQLREDAGRCNGAVRAMLRMLARRFENEAKAAEKAKEETNAD